MDISLSILEDIMPLVWWGISALALILVSAFLIIIILYRKLNRKMKDFESFSLTLQTFASGRHLDTIFHEYNQKLANHEQLFLKNDTRLSVIETRLRVSVDRAELLRFRAFENVGSDLSFALALLNQEGSGVVLSSIHNRDESRVYGKPVIEGVSTYSLTGEEKEVIERAMLGKKI